ncbi:MAG: Na+/H+ antiporter subunit D, partial [Candidatus Thermoplasmatota archaeon]|nr:Na+/H+ antiporter subunit D [Candidatus Thermoplasmatota archaeon]
AGTALAVGVLTLFSMTKIWAEAFWKESAEAEGSEQAGRAGGRGSWAVMLLPIALLAALTVTIGLAAEPILVLSARAAEELLNPANYVQIVLEGLP